MVKKINNDRATSKILLNLLKSVDRALLVRSGLNVTFSPNVLSFGITRLRLLWEWIENCLCMPYYSHLAAKYLYLNSIVPKQIQAKLWALKLLKGLVLVQIMLNCQNGKKYNVSTRSNSAQSV